MTIGGAIALIVIGLILMLGVIQIDLPFLDEYALGLILILAGIAGVVLALTWGRTRTYGRTGTTRVVEREVVEDSAEPRVVERRVIRDDGPPL